MNDVGTLAVLQDPALVEERNSISFRFSQRTWTVIGLVTLGTGLLAMALTFVLPPQYVVSRSLLVQSGSNPNDNDTLVRAFEEIMADKGFASAIKSKTGLPLPVETIKGMIQASRPPAAATINVSVRSETLDTAKAVSAEIVPTLEEVVALQQADSPIETRIQGPIVQQVFQNPIIEQEYVPWWTGLLSGAIIAFLLSFLIAAFQQYRRPVIGSARDVADALDLPVLARVMAVGDGKNTSPQDAVLGMLSAIERLGTNGPIHRLVVVGPESDTERSKLVLALGCAIARNFDQPVALIDADLENSALTKLIGASDEPGLAECLSGERTVEQTLLQLENGHTPQLLDSMVPPAGMIRVMPAGVNRDGSILRMRSSLHQVLGAMSGKYVVVVDGPQVPGPVPVTQLLSMADATIVVVTEGGTSIRDARFAGNALRSNTTNPVGAVVLHR